MNCKNIQNALLPASLLCLLTMLLNALHLLPAMEQLSVANTGLLLLACCGMLILLQYCLLLIPSWNSFESMEGAVAMVAGELGGNGSPEPRQDRSNPQPDPEQAAAEAETPMDIPASIRRMGDTEIWQEIMLAYFEETRSNLEQLATSLECCERQAAELSAHSIKGSSAELLAEPVRRVSEIVEKLARSGELDDVRAMLPRLQEEYRRLERHVRESGRLDEAEEG